MFGRQAKLPVELMYGMPEPEPQSGTAYATQLKPSLTEAYEMVRVKTTRQLDHQAELYNKEVHGKPCMGSISTRESQRNCTSHGQAPSLS